MMKDAKRPEPGSAVARQLSDAARPRTEFGTVAILLMMLANGFSMADRQILGILAEPIKRELGLTDQQIGLLIGLSFALFYSVFGLLLARILERHNRSRVMAVCLAGWSVCTALCGTARGFASLLTLRVGVAMGEASCLPAAQSMIADYVPLGRRAYAMSILVAGSPLGVLIGMAFGGVVSQHLGWRAAFYIAALPGVFVALLIWFTVPDPVRRQVADRATQHRPMLDGLEELTRIPAYWLVIAGTGFIAFGMYSQSAFLASFFLRNHAEAVQYSAGSLGASGFIGLILGLILGLGGAVGTLLGGQIADRLCRSDLRRYTWVSIAAALVPLPFFLMAILTRSFPLAVALLVPATIVSFFNSGPAYTAAVSIVPPHLRATASAITLLMVNLIGLGLGPITVGTLSDNLAPSLGPAEGLRLALALSAAAGPVAAALFWIARRHLCASPVSLVLIHATSK